MTDATELLAAYDAQLRGEPEVRSAARVQRVGPALVATYRSGFALITARDLAGVDVPALVLAALAAALADPAVRTVEWKTRGHDVAPELLPALVAHGFVGQEPESIMIGTAASLAVDVPLPEGVTLRAVTERDDVWAASAIAGAAFGDEPTEARIDEMLQRIAGGAELWIAEAAGEIVTTGRVDPVAGTEFAGIWGGVTVPAWRGRGVYRALTAERARSALRLGKRYINSDSTEYSRPILERSGFTRVSTTTPYEFRRDVRRG